MLSGKKVSANGGRLSVELQANSGDIWVSSDSGLKSEAVPVEFTVPEPVRVSETEKAPVPEKCEKTETTVKTESVCAENTDAAEEKNENKKTADEKLDLTKPYEDMTVAELQACILQKMAKNGPVTEQMKKDVDDNIWRDSLLNWVKSFR